MSIYTAYAMYETLTQTMTISQFTNDLETTKGISDPTLWTGTGCRLSYFIIETDSNSLPNIFPISTGSSLILNFNLEGVLTNGNISIHTYLEQTIDLVNKIFIIDIRGKNITRNSYGATVLG